MQLVVDKIARSFGINEIFKDISFMIDKGEKIGLVGVNGSGKTTLLRCLLAPETVDGGVVRFEPGLKIGYVGGFRISAPAVCGSLCCAPARR